MIRRLTLRSLGISAEVLIGAIGAPESRVARVSHFSGSLHLRFVAASTRKLACARTVSRRRLVMASRSRITTQKTPSAQRAAKIEAAPPRKRAAKVAAATLRKRTAKVEAAPPGKRSPKTQPATPPTAKLLPTETADEATLSEAQRELTALATGRFGKHLGPLLGELIVRCSDGSDWPVHKAALDALIRRQGYGKRDQTAVLKRPRRRPFGIYRTGTKPKAARTRGRSKNAIRSKTYSTELLSLQPLHISCDCADFVRSSLGVCKHGLAVLTSLDAAAFVSRSPRAPTLELGARLSWDPVHPLLGNADRLLRLSLVGCGGPTVDNGAYQRERQRQLQLGPQARLGWITQQLRAASEGTLHAETAVVRVLSEERDRAERLTTNLAGADAALAALSTIKRRLYEYQLTGVRRFLAQGRLLLADDMGLGKTTQAVAGCHALFASNRIKRGVLIVPAALKGQWVREWQEVTDVPITRIEGSPAERIALYRSVDSGFLLIGYEQLLRDLAEIQAFSPELVLLDEAQRIKNWATKSAASVKTLNPQFRLVLTGTPMENRFEELASVMDFVDDTALEPKWRLVPWHTMAAADGTRGQAGVRNLDTLRARLGDAFLRRRRQEVLSQLPSRTDTRVDVEVSDLQFDTHEELAQPIASLMRRAAVRPLTQAEFLKLMQLLMMQRMICNGMAQVNFGVEWERCCAQQRPSAAFFDSLFSPKLAVFRSLMEELLAQGRKVVVFSQWRKMLQLAHWSVSSLLADLGQRAWFFTGAESSKQREHAIIAFHDDPRSSIMFLSDAGGVGLNLQRAANCCINLELPWNPAVLEQRIGRIYRLGQKRPINVYNLVSERGIEARIAQVVSTKRAAFAGLFDGTSDEVRFDHKGSFLDEIAKVTEPAAPLVSSLDGHTGDNSARGAEDAGPDEQPDADDNDDELSLLVDEPPAVVAHRPAGADSRPAPTLGESGSVPDGVNVGALLGGLSLERTRSGGLQITAPPELALPLASLLESFAQSLRQTVAKPLDPGPNRSRRR